MEDKLRRMRTLAGKYYFDAFACKGRNGVGELSNAIVEICNYKTSLSANLTSPQKKNLKIRDYDMKLIFHLSKEMTQEEIGQFVKQQHINLSSLSTIEKRLKLLRIQFNANDVILVAIAKDLRLI